MSLDVLIAEVASVLAAFCDPHPFRIGVDGRTGVGKTTFADDLADALAMWNRHIMRAELDGFHNPRDIRYARGRLDPDGYYRDARDHAAIRRLLLDPLGPEGDGRYALESFDLHTDQRVPPQWRQARSHDTALICDGSFLQRPELRDGFDCVIFLRSSAETSRARGLSRDGRHMRKVYDTRYLPAFDIYEREVGPEAQADLVIDVTDVARPVMIRAMTPEQSL